MKRLILTLFFLPCCLAWTFQSPITTPRTTIARARFGIVSPLNAYANSNNNGASSSESGGNAAEATMGLNELQTLLRDAAQREDFLEAGKLSDVLATRLYGDMKNIDADTRRLRRRKMSWRGMGAAPWLVDRLDSINYTFPTTIQINAMGAVNVILNTTTDLVESTSLEERMGIDNMNMGIVISGNTGSGKFLCGAYIIYYE